MCAGTNANVNGCQLAIRVLSWHVLLMFFQWRSRRATRISMVSMMFELLLQVSDNGSSYHGSLKSCFTWSEGGGCQRCAVLLVEART